MGGRYKPPKEVQGARFEKNLEIHVRRQEVTFAEYCPITISFPQNFKNGKPRWQS